MDKKVNTAREDRFLGIRLMAEGVRCQVKGAPVWDPLVDEESTAHPVVILDGSGLRARTLPYSGSRIDFVMEGDDVTISEAGEVLATGKLESRAPWRDTVMSDGTTVDSAFMGTSLWSDISISHGCFPAESGKGCKFCVMNKMTEQAPTGPRPSLNEILSATERPIEATAIAIQSGWRGMVLMVGGATPPEQRDQWTTDLFEAIMTRFRTYLDDDTLSDVPICSYVYPPENLAEMENWKRCGINTVLYDCQAMDPAYFKAI
ncbi:MAG: radical SAM protein, partial [Desulfobacterales bacterium]